MQLPDMVEQLAEEFGLTPEERSALYPNGQTIFANRVYWAKVNLGMAGLIAPPSGRGFHITEEGQRVLAKPPERLDIKFLQKFPQYLASRRKSQTMQGQQSANELAPQETANEIARQPNSALTPDETMRAAHGHLDSELARQLLLRLLALKPPSFERFVIKLLTAMGYGGSTANAARALGRSGDGGVDGVIDQDPLGLDQVYIQAKRYGENAVGPGAIRDFFGALDQFKAAKGLFMTTSTFSDSARRTAKDMSKRIVLIDGDELTRLMIQYDVGCRIEETMFIKKVDEEFFEE